MLVIELHSKITAATGERCHKAIRLKMPLLWTQGSIDLEKSHLELDLAGRCQTHRAQKAQNFELIVCLYVKAQALLI